MPVVQLLHVMMKSLEVETGIDVVEGLVYFVKCYLEDNIACKIDLARGVCCPIGVQKHIAVRQRLNWKRGFSRLQWVVPDSVAVQIGHHRLQRGGYGAAWEHDNVDHLYPRRCIGSWRSWNRDVGHRPRRYSCRCE